MYGLGLVSTVHLRAVLRPLFMSPYPSLPCHLSIFFPLSSFIFPNKVLNSCENTKIKRTRKEKAKAIKKKNHQKIKLKSSKQSVYACIELCSNNENGTITETKIRRWGRRRNENQTTVWLSFNASPLKNVSDILILTAW